MADYISRQVAIDAIEEHIKARLDWVTDSRLERQGLNAAMCAIEDIPPMDAVEVVRCKDCRWYKTNYMWNGTEVKICAKEAYEPRRNADDFCSNGDRK